MSAVMTGEKVPCYQDGPIDGGQYLTGWPLGEMTVVSTYVGFSHNNGPEELRITWVDVNNHKFNRMNRIGQLFEWNKTGVDEAVAQHFIEPSLNQVSWNGTHLSSRWTPAHNGESTSWTKF